MHALSHTLAHRAPPATRTRVRWQPYNALPSAVSSRSPYLHTPASSVTPSPSNSISASLSLCESERLRPSLPPLVSQIPRENQIRDFQKNKYVIGLVDQAIKSLSEIWRPQDVPGVFMTSSRATVTIGLPNNMAMNKPHSFPRRNTQLPSPVSPLTQPSPDSLLSSSPGVEASISHVSAQASKTNLVPIKGFVHEVLRRSRTSGIVLQTALCYLEAIRSKVPELVQQEHAGTGVTGEPEGASRIILAEPDSGSGMNLDTISSTDCWAESSAIDEDFLHTVRIDSASEGSGSSQTAIRPQDPSRRLKTPSPSLPPLPPLPSPLLCPRRAFLASLILASKFTQDKCYSNRAWAKLSGLPPREIGRCERALGDALEWRLWVGKVPSASAPTSQSPKNGRVVVRSRSDGDLLAGSKTSSSWRVQAPPFPSGASDRGPASSQMRRGLRRCATLPPDDFSTIRQSTFDPLGYPITSASGLPAHMPTWDNFSLVAENSPSVLSSRPQPYFADNASQSPMSTPTLTYSPSSTESSSGDRTVQMTSFTDEVMPMCNGGTCFTSFLDNGKLPFGSAPSVCMTPYVPDYNPSLGGYVSSTFRTVSYATESSALGLYSY